MNGYNFTERVRKVLAMAREEAERLRHEYVGTEHLLLALIAEGEGVAARVLRNLGLDLGKLQSSIEDVVKKGRAVARPGPDLPYTSRAKKVLELAMAQARELNHSYVGTEHLLLGLIDERKGIAAQVLLEHGATLENAQAHVVEVLRAEGSESRRRVRPPAATPASGDAMVAGVRPALSDRVRDIMRDAEDVATKCGANELTPVHVAIALLENGEGLANAVLDRCSIDRPSLIRALTNEAENSETDAVPGVRLEIGKYMVAFQRHVESESLRHSPPTTLNMLLALLDNVREVSSIFEAQGIDAARVRAEARRMSG